MPQVGWRERDKCHHCMWRTRLISHGLGKGKKWLSAYIFVLCGVCGWGKNFDFVCRLGKKRGEAGLNVIFFCF